MIASVVQVFAAIALTWLFGYLVVDLLARGYFRPAAKEAAVALLVGLFLGGLIVFPVLRVLDDPVWFDRALRWTVPALTIILAGVWFSRRRGWRTQPLLSSRLTGAKVPPIRRLLPIASALVLVVAAIVLVTIRPGSSHPDELELYGSREGAAINVTVDSTAEQPADYLLIISESGATPRSFPIGHLSRDSGPESVRVEATKPVRVDLFSAKGKGTQDQPLRWLMLPGQDGAL